MAHNLKWQIELGGNRDYNAVVTWDDTVSPENVRMIQGLAKQAYGIIYSCNYPQPRVKAWPFAPNHAFQRTALFMLCLNTPWLWLEADAIPMRPEWLVALNNEYYKADKQFMGPIVQGAGHCNGVAIYPCNASNLLPKAMRATADAWDSVMKPEMIHLCHDASHLIFHGWGRYEGKLHPWLGHAPSFPTVESLDEIPASTVLFHRNKDGSLIDMLRLKKGMK